MKTAEVEKTGLCLVFLIPLPFYLQFFEWIYNNYDSTFVTIRKNILKVNSL